MRIHRFVIGSCVDGPGRRAVLFVQGCCLHCPGCQNPRLWPPGGGLDLAPETLAAALLATGLPVTISGGEPFDQAEGLARLAALLAAAGAEIIVYTGYALEALLRRAAGDPAVEQALGHVGVLVDGPYVASLGGPDLQYRGSRNQRPIDLPASLASGSAALLDWDTPEIVIDAAGDVIATAPVLETLGGGDANWLGKPTPARQCGQVSKENSA